MTVKTNSINRPVFLPPNNADFEIWLGNEPYVIVRGQIIFRDPEGKIMVSQIDNENQNYTVEDFIKLPEGAPFELLNGKLTHMPSPFTNHQRIALKLAIILNEIIEKHKLGEIFIAPLDVHFDKKIFVNLIYYLYPKPIRELFKTTSKERPIWLSKFCLGIQKTKILARKKMFTENLVSENIG